MMENSLRKEIKQNAWLFIVLLVSALLFYLPTAGAGFVTDQIGWIGQYVSQGWMGIFFAFHDNALHYVYHFAGFLLWKMFGFHGYGWMFAFVTLHCLDAFLSFLIFKKIFSHAGISNAAFIALAGSFLFLLSPYQTEALCWYACIHYPLCVFTVLTAFYSFLFYLQTGLKKYISLFYLFFVISLFTLEISFSFPLMLLAFILVFPLDSFRESNKIKLLARFVLPSFACLGIYFLLSKLTLGSITGHYGSNVHLHFTAPLVIGNLLKYTSKVFFFAQYFPFNTRENLFDFFTHKTIVYGVSGLFILIATCFFVFKNKIPVTWKISGLLLTLFALGLSVILNLYCSYVIPIEGDRFSYFAIIFGGQFIAFFLVTTFKKTGWLIVAVYFLIGCKFLHHNTQSWKMNKEVHEALENNFKWYDANKIYILDLPDNYRGTYMYRDYMPGNSLAETLQLRTGKDLRDKMNIICEFNMEQPNDSVKVTKITPDSVKIEFAQYGNWWWTNGVGALPYSNNDYNLNTGDWLVNTIRFKHLQKGDVILYQCGKQWRELK